MENYPLRNLVNEPLTLIITSTFGSGEAPDNGKVSYFGRVCSTLSYFCHLTFESNSALILFYSHSMTTLLK